MKWLGSITKIIPIIIGAVNAVEKITTIFKSDDPDKSKKKQDIAINIIGEMIGAAELTLDKEIMDVPEFQVLIRKLIDDYVAIQNFVAKFKM